MNHSISKQKKICAYMMCTPKVSPNLTLGVFFYMAKYDKAFKLAVVKAYLKGQDSYETIAKKFNIASDSTIHKWVKGYKIFGVAGLERRNINKSYTVQFKLDVLDYKLRTGKSYQEVANAYGMTEPSLPANWMKTWSKYGIEGLSKQKGRPTMSKKKTNENQNKFTRKSRKYNSYKGKVGTIAPNRVNRRFNTSIPLQKITTDTTEFKYYTKDQSGKVLIRKAYLDPYLDMFNGEILSIHLSKKPNAEAVLNGLKEVIELVKNAPYRTTIHTDQGWAYQMNAFSKELKNHRIFQSMSRRGN